MSNTSMGVRDVRNHLHRIAKTGTLVKCTVCDSKVKVRKVSPGTDAIASLIKLVRMYQNQKIQRPIHFDDFLVNPKHRDISTLKLWDLIKPDDGITGKKKQGRWYPTQIGINFVNGTYETIIKYAHVYKAKALKHSGPEVTVKDLLRGKYSVDSIQRITPTKKRSINA